MGKEFFNGWVLWEKMVFILACSIVVTVMAGCFKLIFDHYRLRKYATLPTRNVELNREKSIIRSLSKRSAKTPMIQKRPRLVNDGVEVPFGIRAIESGIEIDGVWISRNNTPISLPNSRQSSVNSLYDSSSTASVSCRSEPQTSRALQSMNSRPASRPVSRFIDRSFSQDSIISIPSAAEMSQPAAVRYPPHSYMRYENTKHFRKSRVLHSSENLSRPSYDNTRSRGSDRSSSLDSTRRSGSTSSGELLSTYQEMPPIQRHAVNDAALDMLQAHRLSHAAETGQLIPRSRRPGHSGEWASMANYYLPSVSSEFINFSLPRDSTDLSSRPGSSSSHQANPSSTTSSGKAAVESSEPQSAISASSSASYEPLPKVRRASTSFSITRAESNVMREVNSGFAVLKPGTLDAEAQSRTSNRQRSVSPPRRRNSKSLRIDTDLAEKRQSRHRLQKKRRPSEDSVAERTSTSTTTADTDLQPPFPPPPPAIFAASSSSAHLDGPPSESEILRGFEFERRNSPKFSFDKHSRPPSAIEIARGEAVDKGAKYKF